MTTGHDMLVCVCRRALHAYVSAPHRPGPSGGFSGFLSESQISKKIPSKFFDVRLAVFITKPTEPKKHKKASQIIAAFFIFFTLLQGGTNPIVDGVLGQNGDL